VFQLDFQIRLYDALSVYCFLAAIHIESKIAVNAYILSSFVFVLPQCRPTSLASWHPFCSSHATGTGGMIRWDDGKLCDL
jgi:hypothetical protein